MKKYSYKMGINPMGSKSDVQNDCPAHCYHPCPCPCPFPCYHPGQRFSHKDHENFFRLEPFGSLEVVHKDKNLFLLRNKKETYQYIKNSSFDNEVGFSQSSYSSESNGVSILDLSLPYYLKIEFTYKCNIGCLYCYSSSSSHRKETMDFHKFRHLVELIRRENIFGIHVLGGEPFLYPEYIFYLLSNTQKNRTVISTNGTLLNRNVCKKLKDFRKSLTINVGIDSHIPDIHNSLRGKYNETLNGIKNLMKFNINTEASVCLNKQNVFSLEGLVKFLIDHNFRSLQIIPVGTSHLPSNISNKLEMSLTQEIDDYLGRIYQKYEKDLKISFLFPVSFLEEKKISHEDYISFGPCDGAILSSCVSPDFTMSACPSAPCAPNVQIENELREPWTKLKELLMKDDWDIEEREESVRVGQHCFHYGYGQKHPEQRIMYSE